MACNSRLARLKVKYRNFWAQPYILRGDAAVSAARFSVIVVGALIVLIGVGSIAASSMGH